MGNGRFILGEDSGQFPLRDDFLAVPPKTPCGTSTDIGMIHTEIILKKENTILNNIIKAGQPTALKDPDFLRKRCILPMLTLSTVNNMKFVLMAFDAGTSLLPHRARQRAILTALEGRQSLTMRVRITN